MPAEAKDPAELCYPAKSHKGYCRVRYAGDDYHFGKHNSHFSWVWFSEWRRQTIDASGEAPSAQDVKAQLKQSEDESQPSRWRLSALYVAACLALVVTSGLASYGLLSRNALTPEELEVVRGYRVQQARAATDSREQVSSTHAATIAAIRDGSYVRRNTNQGGDGRNRLSSVGLLAGSNGNDGGGTD